jgi:hypothetical protein
VVSNSWPFFQNRVKKWWALSLQTWGKNEFLVKWYSVSGEKNVEFWPSIFFPKCQIGVECLTRRGTEFTLTAALFRSRRLIVIELVCTFCLHYYSVWDFSNATSFCSEFSQNSSVEPCRIPDGFCHRQTLSRYRRGDESIPYASYCFDWRQ